MAVGLLNINVITSKPEGPQWTVTMRFCLSIEMSRMPAAGEV